MWKLGLTATITNKQSSYYMKSGMVAAAYAHGYYAIRFYSDTLRTSLPIIFHEKEFTVEGDYECTM